MRIPSALSALLILALPHLPSRAQTDCDGADHTILAGNLYFYPADLTINVGETVAWINEDGFHDVNGDISSLSGTSYGNPESFYFNPVMGNAMGVCMGAHTFTVPGTYNYDCSVGTHAANGMVASLTVLENTTECNDDLACNFDPDATSAADCIYEDGTFDLSSGIWLVPAAAADPDLDCAIQPGAGILVGVNATAGAPVTVIVDQALTDYINGLVAAGLLTSLNGVLALSALQNAIFSFCGNTLVGVAGLNTITSDWNGEYWEIAGLGFNLAPYGTLADGCPDPDALNYDPCANPDDALCEYTALMCGDSLACNYDSTTVGTDDCVYFDTELFTLEEMDYIGLFDFAACPGGYAGYDDFPVPLGQEVNGGPLTFNMPAEVAAIWTYFGFEAAVQDVTNATVAVCGDTMYYTSILNGPQAFGWDGHGFPYPAFGSYVAPSSSYPDGCVDEEACNFDACAHPMMTESCTYVFAPGLETAEGDTGMVVMTDNQVLDFIATPGDGNPLEWYTECGSLEVNGNVATLTATGLGDCEVCAIAYDDDGCESATCIGVTVVTGVEERNGATWDMMPNPSSGTIRIPWSGSASAFDVFDLNGRRVLTTALQPGVNTADLSALRPGLYLAGPRGLRPERLAIQR